MKVMHVRLGGESFGAFERFVRVERKLRQLNCGGKDRSALRTCKERCVASQRRSAGGFEPFAEYE